jgi:hypothetical protein
LLNPHATAVLLLTRNVDHVFKSFLRVGWRKSLADQNEVVERLCAHMAAAERAIAQFNIPHVKIDYEDFANRPEGTAQSISNLFGVEIRAPDFGFNEVLNHSGVKGRLVARLEKLALGLPASWRAFIKKRMPASVLKRLFPGRRA